MLEFELLQQAMYTDPSDQSIWIYHRWLVAQGAYLLLNVKLTRSTDTKHARSTAGCVGRAH